MKILKAEVVNNPIANTQWGKKRVLNCKLLPSREKVACWSNDINNPIYLSKKPGDIVELIEDDKGKYSVLDREEPKSNISMNRPSSNGSKGSYYTHSNGNNPSDDLEGLDLPEPLSDKDKVRLSKLIRERAKLMSFCIKVADETLKEDGYNFNEISIKSLGVSLFINVNSFLPK